MKIERVSMSVVRGLCERFHAYQSAGTLGVYAFAVIEDGEPVAAYAWQPPAVGCAVSVCPEAPAGVLSLSRMVAVPRNERALRHVSKPLRIQMRRLIDRTRWPVLVTFSDEGLGHTGHAYKCSGWEKTSRKEADVTTIDGARASRYSNGKTGGRPVVYEGKTWIQRWEHRVCERGQAAEWMAAGGWVRVPTGKVWRSGNPAFTYERSAA